MKRLLIFATFIVASVGLLASFAGAAAAVGTPVKASVVYNSTLPNGPRSNLPSVGPEAYAFNEFGNQINLAGTARRLNSVTVTLSSWACVQGTWFAGTCSTPSGSTFTQPITLNIYNPSADGGLTPGSLIASATQTFSVPYRPSASSLCTGGRWYETSSKSCFNGLASDVTFSFSGVTLPDTVVYGIVYNSSHYGLAPQGEATACYTTTAGCPYDSLNIGLSTETDVTAGSDPNPGTVWQNSPIAGEYCDGGTVNTFRLDSPTSACWTGYVPAVQFKAGS